MIKRRCWSYGWRYVLPHSAYSSHLFGNRSLGQLLLQPFADTAMFRNRESCHNSDESRSPGLELVQLFLRIEGSIFQITALGSHCLPYLYGSIATYSCSRISSSSRSDARAIR